MATPPSTVDVAVGNVSRYVDWAAVLAGAILASAISFVLFTFGAGLGLSVTSPYPGESPNPVAFAIGLGLWVLWVSTSSFLAGAYLTGRLRRRIGDATEHEVEVRDAAHGLLVWAVSVLIGAFLAALVTGGVAAKTADVAAGVATGASTAAAQEVAERADPASYWTDVLFRPAASQGAAAAAPAETAEAPPAPAPDSTAGGTTTTAQTTTPDTTAGGTATAQTTAPAPTAQTAATPETAPAPMTGAGSQAREAASRIMAMRITDGKLQDDDRAYLTRIVMDNTGLPEAEASARVDQAVMGLQQARAAAQDLAEKARRFGILVTFLTAASLAIGAAACWWAAILGGQHRDQAIDIGYLFGRWRA
jgi:hypothetical protein